MKKQFETDWGKIIFSLKTRDPNWPVNRRGAGLSLKELAPGQSEPKSVLVSIQARERMTKQGDPELLFRGGVLNRCAGSLFTLGVGGWGMAWATQVSAGSSEQRSCCVHSEEC